MYTWVLCKIEIGLWSTKLSFTHCITFTGTRPKQGAVTPKSGPVVCKNGTKITLVKKEDIGQQKVCILRVYDSRPSIPHNNKYKV